MGEILSVCLTSGNVDDRNWEVIARLTKEIYGKLFADRGYVSQKLFEKLFEQNIQLVTRLRNNMKNKLMDFSERLLLRKRAVIESVNDFLKNICQIEHSRHRSVDNFLLIFWLLWWLILSYPKSLLSTFLNFLCLFNFHRTHVKFEIYVL